MNAFIKFSIWIICFYATAIIASSQLFSINQTLLFVPLFVITFYMIKSKTVKAQGVLSDPKYLNALKAILAFLGLLISTGLKIPFLSEAIKVITNIIASYDQIGHSIDFLVGFILTIYAIVAGKDSQIGKLAAKISQPDIEPKTKDL